MPEKEKKRRPAAAGKKTDNKKSRSARYSANRPEIIATCCFFGLLFAALIGYLSYFTATSEQEMINNSYNSRQEILLSRNYRGTIYSRDGDVLAETRLDADQKESRVYPYGKLFAHAVGYSTKGRTGVESLANYYLINTSTSLANKAANDIAGIKNPGDSVYTTLDVDLQQVADDQLNIYKGAIVVTEVATGKILAMVSHPGFDPNEIGAIWDSIMEDEDSSVLLNRVTQGQYPPGSTFKIVTALEYIRENPGTYNDYSYQCNGYFSSGTGRINCYHGTNHGQVGFESSFAKSCNSSFANIGVNLEQESFEETLEELLFNRPLPIDFPYSESKANVVDRVSMNELMQTSIGQGRTQISPLHLNMITSAIANGGILMKPYAVDRVENDAGRIIKSFEPSVYGSLMTEEEAGILKGLMESVVEEGTGRKLSGLSYTAAGKTGSAEYNDVKEDSHAWFTGFAPVEEPEICVTIIVEGAGSGGDYAVPIARRIFDAYFGGGS
ncbi:MAG: penicillin-binding protein 2 [Lachnospiraceae bacterium]|nr:penicillin-binding transpeptidase domain-containing protein [uncultured Acetatifactor sp.]MCI9571393.1 penicillin-binding protein 2 [Lachnospiraceae bacterium]